MSEVNPPVRKALHVYKDLPCGCRAIGDGTLQHPFTVERCGRREHGGIIDRLMEERDQAKKKAIDSLARYKFAMFGYWAGVWVHLNRIAGDKSPSPFRDLVQKARDLGGDEGIGGVYAQFCHDEVDEPGLERDVAQDVERIAVGAIHSFLKGRLNADGTITLTPAEISKLGGLIGQPIA